MNTSINCAKENYLIKLCYKYKIKLRFIKWTPKLQVMKLILSFEDQRNEYVFTRKKTRKKLISFLRIDENVNNFTK